ncbi:M23 family metallopeptidase [Marispirochaeta aestuarii]|uniref:M23 family metallopeptidase n=1 Tax=Marispirochaeta aestuarii TaxID=1963862 RepID=UPI0029C978E8|nr:M23 family metallopeptidase [Marispirochaeta aestuarii]
MIELIQQQTIRKRRKPSQSGLLEGFELRNWFSLGIEKIRETPEKIAWLSLFLGVSLAVTAMLYSLVPSLNTKDGELLHLPADDQLYSSMVSYLEGSQASEEELVSDLPPLASYLGGIKENVHTVTRGDTLSEIALRYDVKIGTLISYNGIEDVRRIVPGTRLKIPSYDGVRYVVRPGDNLSNIAATKGISVNQILDANNLQSALIKPGDVLFLPGAAISDYEYKKATGTLIIYPTKGRLTSPYGYRSDPFTGLRRFHYGIDIANATGTVIIAAMDGVVLSVENRPAGYGRYVVIKHERGYQTLYGHMNTVAVREGQRVRQGQSLGTMGNTGRSTGSHLHFALYKNNRPVDPLSVLH